MIKYIELSKMTMKELEKELTKTIKDLFEIRFEVKMGSAKEHHKIRNLRKYRAQIITAQKEIASEEAAKLKAQQIVEATPQAT